MTERIHKRAAKAVAIHDGWVLTITTGAHVELPGGGIEPGETPEQALAREVREETGHTVTTARWLIELGLLRPAREDPTRLFDLTVTYYTATVGRDTVPLALTDREADAGYTPEWLPIPDALTTLADGTRTGASPLAWMDLAAVHEALRR